MRKLLRVAGAVGLSVVALVAVSTVSNLVLGAVEKANVDPYGEGVSIDGGKVNVSVTGDGEQTVVLLSGYGTASPVLDFAPLIDELDDTYTVFVIERFGYGYGDLDVTQRTVENVSTELHDTLAKLNVKDYVLVAHSLAGIYSLDYVNRFPGEVAALVTIDGTVPEDFAIAPKIGVGERLLSVTGWVRWMTALNPAITAPPAPVGVYSEREIGQIRLMTIWNYANPAMIDENNRSAENFDAVAGLSYPSELPVLSFLSQQLVDANIQWGPRPRAATGIPGSFGTRRARRRSLPSLDALRRNG
ncbi:alpha/beta fold hydrolase [Glaciibacter superstes]|uniref:alpha/beta fold hydrolase n=1 Tax=Glaciibacter superstes TaxID=501023 RepID=UPI00047B5D86|nr:alpha/beta hydrolase [Glaciibacter superstes]